MLGSKQDYECNWQTIDMKRNSEQINYKYKKVVKYFLFALNGFYFVVGICLMVAGIWMLVERVFLSSAMNNLLLVASFGVLIASGGLAVVVSMVGCCAVWTESKWILRIYTILNLVSLLVALSCITLAVSFRGQINDFTRFDMQVNMQRDYGVLLDRHENRLITYAWDAMQSVLRCCSTEDISWILYRNSEWFKAHPGVEGAEKPYVPVSCCVTDNRGKYVDLRKCQFYDKGPPHLLYGSNDALYTRGCFHQAEKFAYQYGSIIICLACLLILFSVTVIMLTLYLLCAR